MLEFYSSKDFIDETQLKIKFKQKQIVLEPSQPQKTSDKWEFIKQREPKVNK